MSNVWDRSATFLSENVPSLLPIALGAFFVPASISGNFATMRDPSTPKLSLALTLISLAFAVLSLWGQLAVQALAFRPALGRAAAGAAARRLPAALGVMLVLFAALLLLAVPVWGILAAYGVDPRTLRGAIDTQDPRAIAASAWIGLYMLVVAVVVLVAGARLVLILPVVMAERPVLGAIPRSVRLTRGSTAKIVGVLLLYTVVAFVAALAARVVFGSIFRLVMGGDGGVSLASVLTSIVVAAVQTGFTVVFAAFVAHLYVALTPPGEGRPV